MPGGNIIESGKFLDRPAEKALIDAIEKSIEDIAYGNMTLAEILGCLDLVSKQVYEELG